MNIALLSAADAEPYRALMLHAYAQAPDAFTSTAEERAREPGAWWVRRIADPDGLTAAFGTFDDTQIVGTVALEYAAKPKTRHKALIVGLYVLPDRRGQGLARALLQAALDHCRARPEVRVVQLTVTEGNTVAIALYRRLGFVPFGLEPMAILTPGGFKSKVHMGLSLPGPALAAAAAAGAAPPASS